MSEYWLIAYVTVSHTIAGMELTKHHVMILDEPLLDWSGFQPGSDRRLIHALPISGAFYMAMYMKWNRTIHQP